MIGIISEWRSLKLNRNIRGILEKRNGLNNLKLTEANPSNLNLEVLLGLAKVLDLHVDDGQPGGLGGVHGEDCLGPGPRFVLAPVLRHLVLELSALLDLQVVPAHEGEGAPRVALGMVLRSGLKMKIGWEVSLVQKVSLHLFEECGLQRFHDDKVTNKLETDADPGVPVGDGVPAVEGDGLGRAPGQQLQEAQLVAVSLVVDVVRTILFLAKPTLG